MNIAICDDEKVYQSQLFQMLNEYISAAGISDHKMEVYTINPRLSRRGFI